MSQRLTRQHQKDVPMTLTARSRARSLMILLSLAIALGLAAASGAYAVDVYFFNGTMAGNSQFPAPNQHSLKEVSARKLDYNGQQVCVNALDGGSLAGGWDCTTAYNGLAQHPYCGCALRKALVWNNGGASSEVRAQYVY